MNDQDKTATPGQQQQPGANDESAPSPDYQRALEELEPGSPASPPDPDLDLEPIPKAQAESGPVSTQKGGRR